MWSLVTHSNYFEWNGGGDCINLLLQVSSILRCDNFGTVPYSGLIPMGVNFPEFYEWVHNLEKFTPDYCHTVVNFVTLVEFDMCVIR